MINYDQDEYGALVEWPLQSKPYELWKIPVPVAICPPQISYTGLGSSPGLWDDTPAPNRL